MKTLKSLLAAVFLLGVFSRQGAVAGELYKIDPAASTIAFRVKHLLGTAKGKFTQFSGTLNFDREHPEKSAVVATIQTRSIDTAIAKRDEHLRSAEFFDVARYPEITFKSRSVKSTGPASGEITGDFTMHGARKVITLYVKLAGGLNGAGGDQISRWHVTTNPIKRKEFGLLWSKSVEAVSMIGGEVSITMDIEGRRAK